MIVDFKSISLFGKSLFTWITVQTPARFTGAMAEQEACFAYVLQGESRSFSEREALVTQPQEALLSRCGNYVTQLLFKDTGAKGLCSAITIHFHEEVLKRIYQDAVPSFLKQQQDADHPNMVKMEASVLIRQ